MVIVQCHAVLFYLPITSLEIKQKPTIAEVEVSIVSILLHQFEQLGIQNLLVWNQNVTKLWLCTHFIE